MHFKFYGSSLIDDQCRTFNAAKPSFDDGEQWDQKDGFGAVARSVQCA